LQAFTRTLELDGGRVYSHIQRGRIQLGLGEEGEALRSFEAALGLAPSHPAALLGAAEALAASGSCLLLLGAFGGWEWGR
jgi:cytochrome c-type biogenesis protein CcmH/NrfG